MRRSSVLFPVVFACSVIAATIGHAAGAQAPAAAPDLREIVAVLETNRPAGMSPADFNAAAVKGLLSGLEGKASLPHQKANSALPRQLISKSELFDSTISYLRLDRVGSNLPEAVGDVLKAILKTNQPKGVVIDLRYAAGEDYAAAAGTADLFVNRKSPLLNWGDGLKQSSGKGLVDVPVAVLVNEQTSGAAEALAAVLRESGTGLILGSRTAGTAAIPRDVPLSNGGVLRIASGQIELGNGSDLKGAVKPDIEIAVSDEEGRTYYADAFAVIPKTNQLVSTDSTNSVNGTNRVAPRRTRFNEADLVRQHGQRGTNVTTVPSDRQPELPVVNDPVLARALDVLKGLAVVRKRV